MSDSGALANAPQDWVRLMTECVMCERHCTGITLDRAAGVVPRGFSIGRPGVKRLAVIFGEPGGISGRARGTGERELRLYAEQRTPADLLSAVNDLADRCFRTGTWDGQANPFHRRVTELLQEAFGSVERAMRSCYFSNLTKCEKAGTRIPPATRSTCFSAYLQEEILIVRPTAALLFGDNAGAFAAEIEALGPRVILADHPSARPPAWLRGPARVALVERIRALTGVATTASERLDAGAHRDAPAMAQSPVGTVVYRTRTAQPARPTAVAEVGPGHRVWIREYLDGLLANAPAGTRTRPAWNGPYPGVRISGGAIPLDLYAHDDYIRVGIHTTDPRVYEAVRVVPGFQVIRAAKNWFTGYIKEPEGATAIDFLVRGAW